ncbi:hypothetical protein P152DRAFT_66512 [Eremomyces bilateralis CBS 781.70]|uniref:Plasma membrane fusion protein PRM1 n=1 Tax=Eremomyces bilateralis CBS 781.70 TaxID=1392243 RepID=A0A6G1FZE8_9PEZI|nr:uncharacterized protein P152DRAFT_66512 [Eremomyces bilateralis CBS 781.70]KAF1811245.1 hypothetical protein P152DRAFT_66512 [Eremomyces bilateralis CBS 781.70]
MSSAEKNQQQTFPAIPPSLSAGDHEMRDYYAPQDAPRPTPNQTPYLTPYLGLQARLSQVWINRWTILLILVLIRTLLAIGSIDDGLDSARRQALSACTSVETVGSSMASMPHYMSKGVNKMTASGIEKSVNALMSMVTMTVTGVEELVVFVIGMLTNTYLCLITLVVTGSLRAATALIKEVQEFMNESLGKLGDSLSDATQGFEDLLNGFLSKIQGIPLIGNTVTEKPELNLDQQIADVRNLKLPGDLTNELDRLNAAIPTFDDVKNFTETAIRFPFEQLKKVIKDNMGTYAFDGSLLPVAAKEKLSFCTDNNDINDFFDGLVRIESIAKKVFLGVLITAAILACVPMAWREIQKWRQMKERAERLQKEAVDPMDAVYMASRPYTSQFGLWLASKTSSRRHQTLVRWCVAYPTTTPALFVLSLGLAGLFACLCQYILLKSLERQVPGLTAQVGAFTNKVVGSLNNASLQWSVGTNAAIRNESDHLNQELFGWVKTSTDAVNDTLNVFIDKTIGALNDTFGGTILFDPVKEVFNCLIGLKVQGVQQGLTWVHDNAHINFPQLANDTFSLGALASVSDSKDDDQLLANPGSGHDDISAAVFRVTDKLASAIRQEAIISTMILLVWVLIVLIGTIRTVILVVRHDKMRGEGGQTYPGWSGVTDGTRAKQPGAAYTSDDTPAPPTYTRDLKDVGVNPYAPYTLESREFPRHPNDSPYTSDNTSETRNTRAIFDTIGEKFLRVPVGRGTTSRSLTRKSVQGEREGWV